MARPRPSTAPELQDSAPLPRHATSDLDSLIGKARPTSIFSTSRSDGDFGEGHDCGADENLETKSTAPDALPRKEEWQKNLIPLVFPVLLLDSKDLLVISKPSDWVCSAADVDTKKGRKLDPNEQVTNKGFHTLDDLLNYQFVDRERKYLHWWPQLLFGLEKPSFPDLFNESINYGLCHRLDRETSGSIIIGLTELAHQQMRACFHRGFVRKLYVGLLHGHVTPDVQTIERKIAWVGQTAWLDDKQGKPARTQVRVAGRFTKDDSDGKTEKLSLCLLETLESRKDQCRLHTASAIDAPFVGEFYYQKKDQAAKDRTWCPRLFLHEYAIAFPDVSGDAPRVKLQREDENSESVDDFLDDRSTQEWHCVVTALPEDLRDAMGGLTAADRSSERVLKGVIENGILDESHQNVHVTGDEDWESSIDRIFFPYQMENKPITDSPGGNVGAISDEEVGANHDQGRSPLRRPLARAPDDEETVANNGQGRSPLRRPLARAPLPRRDQRGMGSSSRSPLRAHSTSGQTRGVGRGNAEREPLRRSQNGNAERPPLRRSQCGNAERSPLRRSHGGDARVDRHGLTSEAGAELQHRHAHRRRSRENSRSRSRGVGAPRPPSHPPPSWRSSHR